ncbi:MAG: hypothetical protein IH604_13685 [Burkholderiales bacterium]|nr:hypothetical protein [Burkholderiales bacterium]
MDESAFRRTRNAVAPRPCAFEKAMLAGACACSLAARRNIAEREAVTCDSEPAREACTALSKLLRQKSAFALKLTHVEAPLPHAKQMKVECGGLRGLQQAANPGAEDHASTGDVHRLVQACAEKFGGLENLPYSAIVQSVVSYQLRRRRPEQ